MKTGLTREERKEHTYIESADLYIHETEGRDWLIEQGEKAGFVVTCAEAIDINPFAGTTSPEHWSITFYEKGKLDNWDAMIRRRDLAPIFVEYKAKFRK